MEDFEFEADIALRLRCVQLAVQSGAGLTKTTEIAEHIFRWITREDEAAQRGQK